MYLTLEHSLPVAGAHKTSTRLTEVNVQSIASGQDHNQDMQQTVPQRSWPEPWPSQVPSAFQLGESHIPTSLVKRRVEARICS